MSKSGADTSARSAVRTSERPTDESRLMCVVCCQRVMSANKKCIYAIGSCDHRVCYECSTRMRVLCKQNECAICRQNMNQVVFTRSPHKKFDDYELNKCVYFNDYGIYFEDEESLECYGHLLEHPCRKCKTRLPFKNLSDLETHLRKEHELFLCKLCVDNLKVFSSELKYYNRKELVRHRKSGDPDEKCHRGHPLCHFCDERYVDDDELQLHLRREHFFCHFCDPTGLSHFYSDYDALKEHFKAEHYLCKECDCQDEKFTNAFRSEIDLQAHIASVHSQNMSKMDQKKARTLSLDIFIRQRSGQLPTNSNQNRKKKDQRSRYNNDERDLEDVSVEDVTNLTPVVIQPPRPEDFPELGANATNSTIIGDPNDSKDNRNSFSVCLNKNSSLNTKNSEEFPALPSSSILVDSRSNVKSHSFAKPNVMNSNGFKPQTLTFKINKQNNSSNAEKPSVSIKLNSHRIEKKDLSINNNEEFPALSLNVKKNKNQTMNASNFINRPSVSNIVKGESKIENQINRTNGFHANSFDGERVEDKILKYKSNQVLSNMDEFPALKPNSKRVPPGLTPKPKIMPSKPPPGLSEQRKKSSISLSLVAQEVVNAPITENLDIEYYYSNPTNFNDRNHSLVSEIEKLLQDHSKFCSFKNLSKDFRKGVLNGDEYYKECIQLFGRKCFGTIFSELLVLLPDIAKQNELLGAHRNETKNSKGAIPKRSAASIAYDRDANEFVVCPKCQQVLIIEDGPQHVSSH